MVYLWYALGYLTFCVFFRCATTHRQTTDRKSTRRQKLTDKKIFTDMTTDRRRQVADTTTHRQKLIIFLYKTDYHSDFLEGWHKRFAGVVGVAHPDIYKFINSLKSEQAQCEMIRRAAFMGEDLTAPRKNSISAFTILYPNLRSVLKENTSLTTLKAWHTISLIKCEY